MDATDLSVLKLDSNGVYLSHTFYGVGGKDDYPSYIAVDKNRGIYITGSSFTTWQGDGGTDPINPFSGKNLWTEGFILKLADPIDYKVYLSLIRR